MINVLHLGLSYRCNMNCRHCYVTRKRDKLKEEDYYRIIDKLYAEGLFLLYYTFGEPLCSQYFDAVSSYVSKKGMVQVLMTNGSLITDDTIKILKRNQINKVCVSLDHINPELHDENRKFKNAYHLAIEAIKKLVANGIKTEMSVTVNDSNAECLPQIYELAKTLNVNFISFLRQREENGIKKMEKEAEYFNFFKDIILRNSEIHVLFHDFSLLPTLNDMKKKNEINQILYEKYYEMNCCHSKYTLSIEPSGDVKHCNLQNITLGNLLETPIDKILEESVNQYENINNCTTLSK